MSVLLLRVTQVAQVGFHHDLKLKAISSQQTDEEAGRPFEGQGFWVFEITGKVREAGDLGTRGAVRECGGGGARP